MKKVRREVRDAAKDLEKEGVSALDVLCCCARLVGACPPLDIKTSNPTNSDRPRTGIQ